MIDEKMVLLGQRIKDRRTELKYTQAELAEMVGYTSDSIITKIEKGEADPPRSKIIALAKALMVDPAFLMGWADDEGNTRQSIYMSMTLNDELREAARLNGQSISQIVSDAVEKYLSDLDLDKKYFVVVDDMERGGDAFRIEGQFDRLKDAINEAKWYFNSHLVESERKKTDVFVATDIVDDEEKGIFEWRTVWSAKED